LKLRICHITKYIYQDLATDSVNEVRLSPRTNYRQACYHHSIQIEPNAILLSYEDFFGNRIHSFTVNGPHKELIIRVESTVVTHENDGERRVILTPEEDWRMLSGAPFQNKYAEYMTSTRYTSVTQGIQMYADQFLDNNSLGIYEIALLMVSRIHSDFEYMPSATHVNTVADDLLFLKKGVCQDFAHFMISVCRAIGIPARYVSGYHFVGDLHIRTSEFEQASHAWVEVYIPGTGWLGFDPTNNNRVDGRYIKLGHGRDYLDIVPVKGIYRGSAHQKLTVEVDVQRES
jgi:transglutaminase-like putative cysteine protease